MAQMPAVAGSFYYNGVAGYQRQAGFIAVEFFAAAFKADFHNVELFKVAGQGYVLKPVEYVEAGTARATAAF
ncbi:hypothetical protein GCM10011375_03190 [Hymenobacter qilianensis]|uniref:Uncharacterized protein n=1 Tax=Hymenobacter qilianensis TaxID=1385715 RepID=A0ACB5PLU7_9BACT|nr:hypothetical protein GCM10011375_03190 [Hymenobacter qilianensis]